MPNPPPRRLLAALCAVFLAGPAQAQDSFSDFFSSLFGPPPMQRAQPRPVGPRIKPAPRPLAQPAPPKRQARPARERRDVKTAAPAAAAPGQTPATPTAAASFRVAVIGDSEASRLAEGLDDAFADDPRVAVIDKAKDDSGLVRNDFYDWRKEVAALLDGPDHFDLVVIQIGVNDNQKLRLDADHQLEPLSKAFNEVYAQRVDEIAAAFRDKNIPLVWVGLPIMHSPGLSNAALVFNEIAKQHATAAGAHYVDLWDAFSDVNSAYKASGPDINGAIVRLRGPDGVHFTLAGARKAAHFIEPEVKRVLEAKLQPSPDAVPPDQSAPAPEAVAPAPEKPAPEKPLAGKITPLNEPILSPGGALAEAPKASASVADKPAAAAPGRSDDFSLPRAPSPQPSP
ncbi:hypothetical protein M2322_001473 [Rhodoblastus acidophilus]|uniref:SGNH/GDSL hydrolase family protein n=2 Tax=Rhodoblastus acidophilus TaxID=1074 RepID=UPI0022250EFE|nr:DUF459 domain-containing protein [Rhodoblastus acidophilus]MCW2315929.1 hypothetical protein [Rhodoblastus acidophilus]